MNSPDKKPIRYGFLMMPKYSMIAFSSAVEVLRMANRLSGEALYEWPVYTLDGEPVPASNGVVLSPDADITEAIKSSAGIEVLFVCSGVRVATVYTEQLRQALHALDKRGVNLGGICTGTYLLARAGLLDGYRCTLHWENIAGLRETCPEALVSQELFEIDRNRYTASGGSAPLDLMLQLIKKRHSGQLAAQISEQFMCDRMRGEFDKQRVPLRLLIGADQPKLIEAVELMESNLEELINLDDLAKLVGVSRRQLERLFKKYLGCVPRRYYLDLRLKKARQLLLQTAASISDIAIACGFVSASHFSKSYREMFGLSPREERQRQREHL